MTKNRYFLSLGSEIDVEEEGGQHLMYLEEGRKKYNRRDKKNKNKKTLNIVV